MRSAWPFLLAVLLAPAARAVELPPWAGELGLEASSGTLTYTHAVGGAAVRTPLGAEQEARVVAFLEQLELSPATREFTLSKIALNRLSAARLAPGAAAPDGTVWFSPTLTGWVLTPAGRRAVPGIVIGSGSVAAAQALGAPPPPSLSGSAVTGAAAKALARPGSIDFDGSGAGRGAAADAGPPGICPRTPPAASGRTASAVPVPDHTPFEQAAFHATWWAYHAAWTADFITTAMFLQKPKFAEQDPLYTMFGNRSTPGVLGSVIVVHAAASAASWWLYDLARRQTKDWARVVLDAASFGINIFGTGAHIDGTVNNVNLLRQ